MMQQMLLCVPSATTASLRATEQEMRARIANTHTDRQTLPLYILDYGELIVSRYAAELSSVVIVCQGGIVV